MPPPSHPRHPLEESIPKQWCTWSSIAKNMVFSTRAAHNHTCLLPLSLWRIHSLRRNRSVFDKKMISLATNRNFLSGLFLVNLETEEDMSDDHRMTYKKQTAFANQLELAFHAPDVPTGVYSFDLLFRGSGTDRPGFPALLQVGPLRDRRPNMSVHIQ